VEGILAVARLVAAWPEASPLLPPLPGPALAVTSFGFCWLCLWRGAPRLLGLPIMAGALVAGMTAPRPDLVVSGDGRLVAVRTPAGVFAQDLPGTSPFARAAILRQLGVAAAQPLPAAGAAAGGVLACTAEACRFRPRPDAAEVVLLRTAPPPRGTRRSAPPEAAAVRAACGSAPLLVAAEPIRPRCGASTTIDRFTVWRDGAQLVRLGPGGPVVVSDRAWRGARPWVPPPPLPGRPEALPLAPRE
jgi:competence protein ComEC